MPIGAIIARRKLWSRFGTSFPMASSSAAGNALACAAALATLDVVESEKLCDQAARKGAVVGEALDRLVHDFPQRARGIGGRGLLIGLHTPNPKIASAITIHCIERGVLLMPAFGRRATILVEPPLGIPDELLHTALTVLREAVAAG
jgi:putrescine aminotransferase